ncbi:chromosome segregation protein [Bacillus sp. Marseille-P3661]|uniref:chromosome segregation protein n=1 Tax=Bacillus sp. Marseille-P3661 TaxID=1936234 RepID=UPI000C86533D|nr:chromosome segregation protein [Bacillus sp. Marseille-P3661]
MNGNVKMDNLVQKKFENRLDELLVKLEDMEYQLSKKADDIVSIQLLQHRRELDQAESKLMELERKIEILSKEQNQQLENIEIVKTPSERPRFFRRVASIFTL